MFLDTIIAMMILLNATVGFAAFVEKAHHEAVRAVVAVVRTVADADSAPPDRSDTALQSAEGFRISAVRRR